MKRTFLWFPERLKDTGKIAWLRYVYTYTEFYSWDEWKHVYVQSEESRSWLDGA